MVERKVSLNDDETQSTNKKVCLAVKNRTFLDVCKTLLEQQTKHFVVKSKQIQFPHMVHFLPVKFCYYRHFNSYCFVETIVLLKLLS